MNKAPNLLFILSLLLSTVVFGLAAPSASTSTAVETAKLRTDDDHAVTLREPSGELDEFQFMPVVMAREAKQTGPIKLLAPANGANLDTLIPRLVFETDEIPKDTAGCISFDTVPNPTRCKSSFGLRANYRRERVLWYNLKPNTTYYWRVGAAYDYDYSNIDWSVQWTFTTGPSGGAILPAPALVNPPSGAVVSTDTLILDWEAVAGALEYDLSVHDLDEDRWYGIVGIFPPETQVGPDQLAWIFQFADGDHFRWNVVARNDYAWGQDSVYREFSIANTEKKPDINIITKYDMYNNWKDIEDGRLTIKMGSNTLP